MTSINPAAMTDEALEQTLTAANDAYRNTDASLMPNDVYDMHIAELRRRKPSHSFLAAVEPEDDFGLGKVRHKKPMLSILKAYTDADLFRWVRRVEAVAADLGMDVPVPIKINAKLDGMAGRLESGVLASRGDGATGNDITHMLQKGLVASGDGDGELVMLQSYFDEYLADEFKHPRNVVTGAVGADTPRPAAQQALADQSIHFVSYQSLKHVYTDTTAVVEALPVIREQVLGSCDYPTDGLILVVEDPVLRDAMGSSSHHHHWMLASKTVTETADVSVKGILWHVGRTGRLSPIVKVSAVKLSGAVISKVSGHHAENILASGIGPGAVLTITRSGEVVPAIIGVRKPCLDVELPTQCPCCDSTLTRQRDFLICANDGCPDRLRARFNHFFHILGKVTTEVCRWHSNRDIMCT